jgi:hypothetical protein
MCGITGYVKFIKSLSSVDINNLEKMNNFDVPKGILKHQSLIDF